LWAGETLGLDQSHLTTGRTGPITLRADDGLLRIFRLGNWDVEVERDLTSWPRLGNCLRQSVTWKTERGDFFFMNPDYETSTLSFLDVLEYKTP
jgi:hypothetical protein